MAMAKGTVNKVSLLGRLGKDPEVRATATGTQVVNLNVATREMGPKDQAGQRAETTEWHRCILFGKTAEVAAMYLQKGSLVYLEGRLQTRSWEDQQGTTRYTTEIVCFEMQLVGGRNDNQQPGQQATTQNYQQQAPAQNYQQPAQQYQQQPQQAPAQKGPPANFQQQIGVNPNQQPVQQAQPEPTAFDDFDDDIPF